MNRTKSDQIFIFRFNFFNELDFVFKDQQIIYKKKWNEWNIYDQIKCVIVIKSFFFVYFRNSMFFSRNYLHSI